MKIFLSGFALIIGLCVLLVPVTGFAQEEEQGLYSYGEVLSANQDQMTVREFDYETGEETDIVYYFIADTILDSVESADQIKPGDLVDVEFTVSADGKNIAKEVLVDRIEDYQEVDEEIVVIE